MLAGQDSVYEDHQTDSELEIAIDKFFAEKARRVEEEGNMNSEHCASLVQIQALCENLEYLDQASRGLGFDQDSIGMSEHDLFRRPCSTLYCTSNRSYNTTLDDPNGFTPSLAAKRPQGKENAGSARHFLHVRVTSKSLQSGVESCVRQSG